MKSKGITLGAIFIVALFIGMMFVSTVSAQDGDGSASITAGTPTVIDPPEIDDVEDNDFTLPKEDQKIVIEAIKASDLTNKEQNDLIKKLKDIWKGKSELSESEQRQVLSEAAVILYDYLGIDQPAEVGILWYQKAHAGLARIAAQKMGIPATYLNLIESEASI